MQNENEYSYILDLDFAHFAPQGYFTPAGYQYLANMVVGRHLLNYGYNFENMMPLGISWVLLSFSIDIINPLKNRDQKLIGKTWYSEHKGLTFRREISICNQEGLPIINCATYSILLDLASRKIYKSRELPFELMPIKPQLLLKAKPSFKQKIDFTLGELYTVKRSYLDMIGHVNNNRYSDFCLDALSDEQADLSDLKRIELYFGAELKYRDQFRLNKAEQDGQIIIQGYNQSQDKPSFYGVFGF